MLIDYKATTREPQPVAWFAPINALFTFYGIIALLTGGLLGGVIGAIMLDVVTSPPRAFRGGSRSPAWLFPFSTTPHYTT